MFLLIACAESERSTPSLAGWEVTQEAFGADGAADYVQTVTYDDGGHVLIQTFVSDTLEESTTTVWDGDCPVEGETIRQHPEEREVLSSVTTCDEHDNRVSTVTDYVDVFDGITENTTYTYDYANTYDSAGRLVRVRAAWQEYVQVRTYGWGDCDEPIFSSYVNDSGGSGDSGVTELRCREDGQTARVLTTTLDADGAVVDVGRSVYTYDTLGRQTAQSIDDGAGTDVRLLYTWRWADPTVPGPTSITLDRSGVFSERWDLSYRRP